MDVVLGAFLVALGCVCVVVLARRGVMISARGRAAPTRWHADAQRARPRGPRLSTAVPRVGARAAPPPARRGAGGCVWTAVDKKAKIDQDQTILWPSRSPMPSPASSARARALSVGCPPSPPAAPRWSTWEIRYRRRHIRISLGARHADTLSSRERLRYARKGHVPFVYIQAVHTV